jgi:hypothetical protein
MEIDSTILQRASGLRFDEANPEHPQYYVKELLTNLNQSTFATIRLYRLM